MLAVYNNYFHPRELIYEQTDATVQVLYDFTSVKCLEEAAQKVESVSGCHRQGGWY